MAMLHRLLCFLKVRDEFDYVPPFAPEVNHPYEKDAKLNCCAHCGGGSRHAIHSEPYDARRLAEICGRNKADELTGWYDGTGFKVPDRCPPHLLGADGCCIKCGLGAPAEVARMRPEKGV